jgi:branched-chain amino acid transport system ATP-binding protein
VAPWSARNGAGKSTTMKAIMGLMARRRGRVAFRGADISACAVRIASPGSASAGCPRTGRVFTDLTVRENLAVARQPPREARRLDAEKLYALSRTSRRCPTARRRMSGGEQQMLTVARTLMGNPVSRLLDEPSEGVAPLIVEEMARMIVALKKEGVAILLSEQNLHFAAWCRTRRRPREGRGEASSARWRR